MRRPASFMNTRRLSASTTKTPSSTRWTMAARRAVCRATSRSSRAASVMSWKTASTPPRRGPGRQRHRVDEAGERAPVDVEQQLGADDRLALGQRARDRVQGGAAGARRRVCARRRGVRWSSIGRPTSRSAPSTWTAATLARWTTPSGPTTMTGSTSASSTAPRIPSGSSGSRAWETHGIFLSTGRRAEDSTGGPSDPRRWRARSAPSHTTAATISATPIPNAATPIGTGLIAQRQLRQNPVPVVDQPLGQQRQRHVAPVGDVDRHVGDALADPEQHHRGGGRLSVPDEVACADRRDQHLVERAAEDAEEATEDAEDDVAGLVKHEIDEMHEGQQAAVGGCEPTRQHHRAQDEEREQAGGPSEHRAAHAGRHRSITSWRASTVMRPALMTSTRGAIVAIASSARRQSHTTRSARQPGVSP